MGCFEGRESLIEDVIDDLTMLLQDSGKNTKEEGSN